MEKKIYNLGASIFNEAYPKFSYNKEYEGKASETDSIKFKISSKTLRGKKDSTKDTTRHFVGKRTAS